jgi:hypothetical protein
MSLSTSDKALVDAVYEVAPSLALWVEIRLLGGVPVNDVRREIILTALTFIEERA